MVAKTVKKDKIAIFDLSKDLRLLESRIKESGISRVLEQPEYKKWGNNKYESLRKTTQFDSDSINMVVKRSMIADIIANDLYWFARWVTEAKDQFRIERVHKIASDFFRVGPSAIPDDLKGVAHYAYRPRILEYVDNMGYKAKDDFSVKMLIIPRGLAKTTIFHVMHAIQRYMKDPLSKWLVVHGNKEKAKDNLFQMRMLLNNRYLSVVRPDIFATERSEYIDRGGRITSEKINLAKIWSEDDPQLHDIRRESTFFVGSPNMDMTGMHPDGELDDDLVIDETSRTIEETDKLEMYYRNNFALANMPGRYYRFLTGTFWWEQSLYHRLFEDNSVSYFHVPAWWYDKEDGKTKMYVTALFNDEIDEHNRNQYKTWYEPHMCISPQPFQNSKIDLKFNTERDYITMNEQEIKWLKRDGVSVQVCDPAYSSKGKTAGDKKSRFTITQFVVKDDTVYIVDCWQSMGDEYENIIRHNLVEAEKHDIDFYIQDAQGTQGGLYDSLINRMREWKKHLRDFKHGNAGPTATKGKIEIANAVLKEYFKMGNIKVVRGAGTEKVYQQIMGHDRGMDIIDTLVYLMSDFYPERDVEQAIAVANRRRMRDRIMREKYGNKGQSFRKSVFRNFG